MGNIILQTRDLCKTFKGQEAVKNVSLTIEENSLYGLLGPNGAGKSTILKMLTGMLRPTSGQILFEGHPWQRKDLNDIGALIESPPLYENLTAKENLKVRTTLFGLPSLRIPFAAQYCVGVEIPPSCKILAVYLLLLIRSGVSVVDQHIKIPPNFKLSLEGSSLFRRNSTAHQSSVFLFGGLVLFGLFS